MPQAPRRDLWFLSGLVIIALVAVVWAVADVRDLILQRPTIDHGIPLLGPLAITAFLKIAWTIHQRVPLDKS